MRRLLLLITVMAIASVALPRCRRAEAQVNVIRQLPASGANSGAATWREAYPEPDAVRAAGATELTGRLSAGGRGGRDDSGETVLDVATDSRVTLIQPLGSAGALSLDAAALRTRSATDESQDYGGSIALDLQRVQLKASLPICSHLCL